MEKTTLSEEEVGEWLAVECWNVTLQMKSQNQEFDLQFDFH